MSYVRGLIHGTVAGTLLGLCVAPQPGEKTRAQVRAATSAAREGVTMTGRALRRAAPVAGGAAHMVVRIRHRGEDAGNGSAAAHVVLT